MNQWSDAPDILEKVGIASVVRSRFARDDASIKQILERIVHRAHALASTRLDDAVDLLTFKAN